MTFAAAADRRSGHPLAEAVVEHATRAGIVVAEPATFETHDGRGVAATVDGKSVLVGNQRLLTDNDIAIPDHDPAATVAWVAIDGTVVARLTSPTESSPVHATPSPSSARRASAESRCSPATRSRSRPHRHPTRHRRSRRRPSPRKQSRRRARHATRRSSRCDDIALLTDDLTKIVFARAIARRAYRTIKENLFVGVGVVHVHVLGITAALIGLIGPVQAAIIHLGADVLVFLNSTKLLRVHIDTGPTPKGTPLARAT